MRKIYFIVCCITLLSACDKHDPILTGIRTPIFDGGQIRVLNQTITDVPPDVHTYDNSACKYTQDSKNIVWDGARRVFSVLSGEIPVSVRISSFEITKILIFFMDSRGYCAVKGVYCSIILMPSCSALCVAYAARLSFSI